MVNEWRRRRRRDQREEEEESIHEFLVIQVMGLGGRSPYLVCGVVMGSKPPPCPRQQANREF